MAEKKYRLTGKAAPFVRGGEFQFQVRFERTDPDGARRLVSLRNAPVLSVPVGGVVSTTNSIAQLMIEHFMVPQGTRRNGQLHPAGNMFEDITGTGAPVDVDLDPIFESA